MKTDPKTAEAALNARLIAGLRRLLAEVRRRYPKRRRPTTEKK